MAIKIPIITVFDSKGLKQAQFQLNKVRGNFRALGRNFAIAGAAIGAVTAALGKSVQAAAEQQKVYAQTEAVLKSTGTTANGTADDIRKLAESLQRQTAFADDAIQSGANLLLTFKNIQNQAGANNDIFDQTVAATLDVARAMGTSATGEAIRLGKALNDPVKGISALTRVGITFTDAQKEQIKVLTESGDIMSAQKIILAELQSQFGGSAAAFAQTFAGQLESLNNELGDMGEEIGFIVMPAVQSLVAELRELIPVIGPQIKDALGSVDWASFTKSLFDAISVS
jgi:phage-related minor tail protein